jgi:hypothetical protein
METKAFYQTGTFKDNKSAERAYNRFKERGYTDEEINIILSMVLLLPTSPEPDGTLEE